MSIEEIGHVVAIITGGSALLLGLWRYLVRPLGKFMKNIGHQSQEISDALPHWLEAYYLSQSYGISLADLLKELRVQGQINEKRIRFIVNNSHLIYFETDAVGACTYVSAEWCKVTGISKEKALGFGWVLGIMPDERTEVEKEWYTAIKEKRDFDMILRYRTGLRVHVIAVAICDEKDIVKYIGVARPLGVATFENDSITK